MDDASYQLSGTRLETIKLMKESIHENVKQLKSMYMAEMPAAAIELKLTLF